jgi:SAM-dependent methyltransferase
MPGHVSHDWYESPLWYDVVFAEDTPREAAFLEQAFERFGRVPGFRRPLRVLEPACGSGPLVEELARRGARVTGFDASESMLAYARNRLQQSGLRATLRRARMERFRLRGRFHLAHCLISTFKYLLEERHARAHLQCVAEALVPGGLYVLGIHLSAYDWPHCQHERWVGRRNGLTVTANIRSWPPDALARTERVRTRMLVEEHGQPPRRVETNWKFRTYDAAQAQRLLRSAPELEHVATYDFTYDWSRPRVLDDVQLDVLLILRRR